MRPDYLYLFFNIQGIAMYPMQTIAVRAARAAGQTIIRAFAELDKVEVTAKGINDYVTNVDKEAESAIIYQIRKSYPDHTIVGEEGGENKGSNKDYVWIIDPLDGTNNFVRGIPHFAVSIALQYKGKTEVANTVHNECFNSSGTSRRFLIPKANKKVRRKANPFPTEEHLNKVIWCNQHKHRECKKWKIRHKALNMRVMAHVTNAINMH